MNAIERDDVELQALKARLVNDARRDGLIDVAYDIVDSPVGPLLVASTTAGVVRVAFDTEGHDSVLQDLADTISPRLLLDRQSLSATARQLDEYFDGDRHVIDVPTDLRAAPGFRRTALLALSHIDYGTTASYRDLAAMAGNAKAIRAAASACSHNPVPIVLPCHRVIRSDGAMGEYLGGRERKQFLLAHEAGR